MGLLSSLFRRPRRVTDQGETVQLEGRPLRPPAPPVLAGNVQGVGRREGQEDSFALVNATDGPALREQGLFAVVADGMGGMEDGKAASEAAVDGFLALFQALGDSGTLSDPEGMDLPGQLREGVRALSGALSGRFAGRSGTTAVAIHILGDRLHWVSVGDSAIFLARNGGVFQLNREHTHLNQLYLEELGREPSLRARAEGDEDARRLSSFLGMDPLAELDQNLRPFRLLPGDALLLCSDGISGVLTPPELAEALRLPPDEGCRLLETYIQEKNLPGQDNYTGIILAIPSNN